MIARRSEGGLYIEPGCPASACDSQTPTSMRWRPFSSGCRTDRYSPESSRTVTPRLFAANENQFVMVMNLTQNRRNIFHSNCVPRHIGPPACSRNPLFNTNKGIFHPSLPDSLIDRNLFSTMSCSISRMKFKVIKTGRPILSEDVCHFLVLAV